ADAEREAVSEREDARRPRRLLVVGLAVAPAVRVDLVDDRVLAGGRDLRDAGKERRIVLEDLSRLTRGHRVGVPDAQRYPDGVHEVLQVDAVVEVLQAAGHAKAA